jgi:hypothetical protein
VDYHDQRKIENLKKACQYLTKYDESLELLIMVIRQAMIRIDPEQDDPLIQPIHSELVGCLGLRDYLNLECS